MRQEIQELTEALELTLGCLKNWVEIAEPHDLRNYDFTAMEKAEKALESVKREKEECFEGYSRSRLAEVFNDIVNPEDWKGPITASVKIKDVDVTISAIRFFTATSPIVRYGFRNATVNSEGYRQGPAGDR
jgi:hypothetical protein